MLTLQSLFGFILKYDCGGDKAFIFHMSLGGKVTPNDCSIYKLPNSPIKSVQQPVDI